jgi:hypothetical protein
LIFALLVLPIAALTLFGLWAGGSTGGKPDQEVAIEQWREAFRVKCGIGVPESLGTRRWERIGNSWWMTGFLSQRLVPPFVKECRGAESKQTQRGWSAINYLAGQSEWKDRNDPVPAWWDAYQREDLHCIVVRFRSETTYLIAISRHGDVWVRATEGKNGQ